jgi:hypothetical protein
MLDTLVLWPPPRQPEPSASTVGHSSYGRGGAPEGWVRGVESLGRLPPVLEDSLSPQGRGFPGTRQGRGGQGVLIKLG